MKIKLFKVICIVIAFVFSFNCFGIIEIVRCDDALVEEDKTDKQELDVDNTTDVIPVNNDIGVVNNSGMPDDRQMTSTENASSVALGLIQSGKNKDQVQKELMGMGYTELEAEIGYSKAFTQNTADNTQLADEPPTTEPTDQPNNDQPAENLSPEERVAKGIETKPTQKFHSYNEENKNFDKEATTVQEMTKEGYSMDEIVAGLDANGYAQEDIIGILKQSGVSSEDTYDAVSKLAVSKAEAAVEADYASKPTAKFKTGDAKDETQKEADTKQAKKDALQSVVDQMKEAGFDLTPALGKIVADLKDAGMSASEVKSFLIGKVAEQKPRTKFRGFFNGFFWRVFGNKKPTNTTVGNGEVQLAKAMMDAGFSDADIESAFKNQMSNGRYGNYSYSDAAIQSIMGGAKNLINEEQKANTNVDTTPAVKLEQDILNRQTQAMPI